MRGEEVEERRWRRGGGGDEVEERRGSNKVHNMSQTMEL